MPKISVVVPVYNVEDYLHRCIDSIIEQTFTDFELLLINDGSTDNSGAICDEYAAKDNRIRVFHKKNGGVSSARNLGLDNSIGDWVTFADSDDYTYSCWLENFVYRINNTNIDLICQGFDTNKVTEAGLVDQYGINFLGPVTDAIDLMYKSNILGYCWNKLYRLDIINSYSIRFDERINLKEDELFLFQYAQYCKLTLCIDRVGYYYNVPDWESKYKISSAQKELILKGLFALAYNIYQDKSALIYKKYLYSLSEYYFNNVVNNSNDRHLYIKKIRNILKKDYKNSPIFFFTKIVIYLDPTTIISSLFILLHQKVKNFILS